MADKSPAFQFYPKDFLTDERVVLMSNTEVGIYVRLLCFCWLEGTLPLETQALARMARMPIKQFTRLWENSIVKTCFKLSDEDGRLHHKRLDEERDKQRTYNKGQSESGKRGAEARWGGDERRATPRAAHSEPITVPHVVAIDSPMAKNGSSSPSSSASPPAVSQSERAGRLREELYPEWYAKYRHGARLRLVANSLEWQDAESLVRTWPDDRLEKLAKIVLTTDDPFIAGTDRSFKIFALKASWADDRLRQWEKTNGVAV
jgi:uncharacterized protein YdaU (DUF1376 family)